MYAAARLNISDGFHWKPIEAPYPYDMSCPLPDSAVGIRVPPLRAKVSVYPANVLTPRASKRWIARMPDTPSEN